MTICRCNREIVRTRAGAWIHRTGNPVYCLDGDSGPMAAPAAPWTLWDYSIIGILIAVVVGLLAGLIWAIWA